MAGWTGLLALGTWGLVYYSRRTLSQQQAALREQQEVARTQLKVSLHMSMEDRFDGPTMLAARARLADQLLSHASTDDMDETVLDFFESLAILDRLGFLLDDLTWNSFSFYAMCWWSALKDYVVETRKEDAAPDYYDEFERFADKLYDRDAREHKTTRAAIEPTADETRDFLEDEKRLAPPRLPD